jgi:cell division transport system ATP-binding protein
MAGLMSNAPQISLQGVSKTYPNGTVALRDVTLEIPKQDFVFLVGPSGAGKSTLVRLLIREEKATSGSIRIEGQELGRLKRRHLPYLRRKIGMVFQDFKLLPNLTVFHNVGFALRVTEGALRHLKPKVEEVLSIVGL